MPNYNILVINPGSTSDEVSYFTGEKEIFHITVRYSPEDLKPFEHMKATDQFEFRREKVLVLLKQHNIALSDINVVIGRGGLTRPIACGVYETEQAMLDDLYQAKFGDHPCNLGAIIAHDIAKMAGVKSFIADPGVADERWPLAIYSGMPEIDRICIWHALNQKRVGRHAAAQLGKQYSECNFVIIHAGGGISIGAHLQGQVVDVNNALNGDGPFSPLRSGGVQIGALVNMCYSGKYTANDIKLKIHGKGGLQAYTGTSDCIALEKYIATGEVKPGSGLDTSKVTPAKAKEIYDAMIYQMAKEIGAMAIVLKGKVDAVIVTGGLAYSKYIVDELKKQVEWIAQVMVYPGGDEMAALRVSAQRALDNPKLIKKYRDQ